MTDTQSPRPPSIRRGSPRDLAIISCIRNHDRYTENFASYLASLDDTQAAIFQNTKQTRKEVLDHQLDMLDAMFTYLSIHADRKSGGSQSNYTTALRSQNQFCKTLKLMKDLSTPKNKEKDTDKK